jgi:hypothetical protein
MAVVQTGRAIRNDGADLGGYLAAGRAFLAGGYDADAWQNSWPPFFSMLLVPLVWLARALPDPRQRQAAIALANLGLSVWLVALCARSASPARRPGLGAYAAAGLFAAPYLRHNLYYHQVNVLLALMCAVAFARLSRRRDDPAAGTLVGIAASAKVQPVLLLPYLCRRPRALAAALATGVICALAPALHYGTAMLWRAWRFWLVEAIPAHAGGYGVSFSAVAHNLACLAAGAPMAPEPRRLVAEAAGSALALAILALLYLWIARRRARGRPQPPMPDLAALFPAAVLASPLAWRYHLVALVPAQAALSVYLSRPGRDPGRGRIAAALLAVGVLLGYASELGALPGLGQAVERLEGLGMAAGAAVATVGALLAARSDGLSDAFAPPGPEEPVA